MILCCCFFILTDVTVSLEQPEYSIIEGETLTVCASITAGASNKELMLDVSTVEGIAECM